MRMNNDQHVDLKTEITTAIKAERVKSHIRSRSKWKRDLQYLHLKNKG